MLTINYIVATAIMAIIFFPIWGGILAYALQNLLPNQSTKSLLEGTYLIWAFTILVCDIMALLITISITNDPPRIYQLSLGLWDTVLSKAVGLFLAGNLITIGLAVKRIDKNEDFATAWVVGTTIWTAVYILMSVGIIYAVRNIIIALFFV